MIYKNIQTHKDYGKSIKNSIGLPLAGAAFLSLLVGCEEKSIDTRPNILVILLDDAGYNDFGFMGCRDLQTPNIDSLAARGVRFTDAHVSASVCGPSRAGILTGRYQQRFGYECNPESEFGLSLNEKTFGDIFHAAGYTTACIGKWHQGNGPEYQPNKRGFDYFFGFLAGSRPYFYNAEKCDRPDSPQCLQLNGVPHPFEGYLTDKLSEGAVDFIRKADKPFAMYLSYNAVHTPMEATAEDLARFEGHSRQQLAAMTWAVDRAIGSVTKCLKETGKLDNTLIFFLSDNGGAHNNQSSNYPLKGFKGNKFEGGHRVPFFITWGKHFENLTEFNGLSSSLDIMATAASAAGIDINSLANPLDGTDLLPYLNGKKTGSPHDKLFWRKDKMAAARSGNYKLISVEGVGDVVYDLAKDPGETIDLSENPEIIAPLKEQLTDWQKQLISPLWFESEGWNLITLEIHSDLMQNRAVRYYSPEEMNATGKHRN